ncbi:MAG: flagellar protein FlgN [Desulfomonilia bacterium]|jgi:hypothetical protein
MSTVFAAETSTGMIGRLERERDLVERLIELLKKELDFLSNQDAEALEQSLPEKHQILRSIAENRNGGDARAGDPLPGHAERIRTLQQELVVLWRKASGLNELSKSLVTGRLEEIGRQLEMFFTGSGDRYDRQGKKARNLSRTVNTGV